MSSSPLSLLIVFAFILNFINVNFINANSAYAQSFTVTQLSQNGIKTLAPNNYVVDTTKINHTIQYEYPELETAPKNADITELTNYLIANYTAPLDRIRIIYLWILQNIDYTKLPFGSTQFEQFFNSPEGAKAHRTWEYVLYQNRHDAICDTYSQLFSKMLEIAGIKSRIVSGFGFSITPKMALAQKFEYHNLVRYYNNLEYINAQQKANVEFCKKINNTAKQVNCSITGDNFTYSYPNTQEFRLAFSQFKQSIDQVNLKTIENNQLARTLPAHAWNVVFLNGAPYMFDLTWSDNNDNLGYNYNYFMVAPKVFLFNHIPLNDSDQLLEKPIASRDFVNNIINSINIFNSKNQTQIEQLVIRQYPLNDNRLILASYLIMTGEARRAKAVVDDIAKHNPNDVYVKYLDNQINEMNSNSIGNSTFNKK